MQTILCHGSVSLSLSLPFQDPFKVFNNIDQRPAWCGAKAYYSISQESFGVLPWSLTQSELPLRHPFTLLVAAFLTTLKNVLMKSVIDSFPPGKWILLLALLTITVSFLRQGLTL